MLAFLTRLFRSCVVIAQCQLRVRTAERVLLVPAVLHSMLARQVPELPEAHVHAS